MYKLKKNGMKILKIIHLFTACCWLGGAVSMITLNLNNFAAVDTGMLYGINTSSHLIDVWVVVIFGALGCLVSGFIYGIITNWGFIKHRWVLVKWLVTIACMLSGTFFLGVWEEEMLSISRELGNNALTDPVYLSTKAKHLYMSFVQISALLFMIIISVFKPWGKRKTTKV